MTDPASIEIPNNHKLTWIVCEQLIDIVMYNNVKVKEKYVAL